MSYTCYLRASSQCVLYNHLQIMLLRFFYAFYCNDRVLGHSRKGTTNKKYYPSNILLISFLQTYYLKESYSIRRYTFLHVVTHNSTLLCMHGIYIKHTPCGMRFFKCILILWKYLSLRTRGGRYTIYKKLKLNLMYMCHTRPLSNFI